MIISFTGLVYSFVTIGLAFITYRFFQYWKKEKTTVSKTYFYAFFFLSLVALGGVPAGTVFSSNSQAIRILVVITSFLLTLSNAFFSYLFFYLRFPKISPWWGFGTILVFGITLTFLTIIVPSTPVLEPSGGIDWDLPLLLCFLRFLIYFFGIFPLATIVFKEFRTTKNPLVKTKALFLSLIFLFILFVIFVDFVIEPIFGTKAIISEIAILILAVICGILYLFSKLLQPTKYVKKVF